MTDAAGGRNPKDDPVVQMSSLLAANGFPRMPASVLMTLMVSEEGELTAEQLGTRLGASPAAISGAVRYLMTIGMIRRHLPSGSRRYLYELPEHSWYEVSLAKDELYARIVGLAERVSSRLGPRAQGRMDEMAGFFRFLQERMPAVLAEWNELQERRGNPN